MRSATGFRFDQIIGRSRPMQEVLCLARKVAESDVRSVLLQGESGTGKDCLAKAIHHASSRADRPFVALNCAALPANLIESELFGYEKGAFTDAKARKAGLLEQANGGTILLDEISELDINYQAKLLRVLEEGAFRRVGGLTDTPMNTRVIATSNLNLKREVEAGRFRLDLYYRLAAIQLEIPPVSERGDDVLFLAQHFISNHGIEETSSSQKIKGFTDEVGRAFLKYGWPGNVREIRNVIQRAAVFESGEMISMRYLPSEIGGSSDTSSRPVRAIPVERHGTVILPEEGISLDEVETSLLRQALTRCGGNQTRAAQLVGLTRDQFRYRWKKLRHSNPDPRSASLDTSRLGHLVGLPSVAA